MKMQTREYLKSRFEHMREIKREREETRRWENFLIDRAEFDEAMEREMDVYELMMKNER
jgi:hypothetical protein